MTWPATVARGVLGALCALALSGCVPAGQSQADEEKEPHFMAGKKRVSTLDYSGAIDCFEKALEVNPRSGAAHFELAWLYEEKETDPAAAIYHYQTYLKLRPDAPNARVVKQRITTCKQELARDVSLGPLNDRQQKEFEKMAEENKRYLAEIQRLSEDLEKWQAYAGRLAGTNNPGAGASGTIRPRPLPSWSGTNTLARLVQAEAPAQKTHTVKAGETVTVIAKKYGIKVEVLLAANPRVDPRRLKIGQALVIPVP